MITYYGSGANYDIITDAPDYLLIQDIGPWDQYKTITNTAETVVEELADKLGDRKLYYVDSEGITDQLLVLDGKFNGFKFGGPDGQPKEKPVVHSESPRDENAFINDFRKTNPDWKND